MTGTNLNFDTGTITLYVQGDPSRKFAFNPTDQRVLKGFLRLVDEADEKMKDFSKRAEGIEESGDITEAEFTAQTADLMDDIDSWFRGTFDSIFGEGQAQIVFGDTSSVAINSDGEYIMIAMLMALYPIFEKEIQTRSDRIDKVCSEIVEDLPRDEKELPTEEVINATEEAEKENADTDIAE